MKKYLTFNGWKGGLAVVIMSFLLGAFLPSCHDMEDWNNDPRGNFDALWKVVDEHYCYFGNKDVDWDAIYAEYSAKVNSHTGATELFDICSQMLDRLRDGHVNLSSGFQTSYYRRWWSEYPQNYNRRLIEENYLDFNYKSLGPCYYAILKSNVGYLRIGSFASGIGEGNLDNILYYLRNCTGLVIDIRDNGGGQMTAIETYARRFIQERTLAGYISHKTGPGHNDFSEPYAYFYEQPPQQRVMWYKPVAVLVNRSTFSAANQFAAFMKCLPQVKLVGDLTGGGSGMPLSLEIPCGWGIRMSACPMLDPQGHTTEEGVAPSDGCRINMTPEGIQAGRDAILDFAIELLK